MATHAVNSRLYMRANDQKKYLNVAVAADVQHRRFVPSAVLMSTFRIITFLSNPVLTLQYLDDRRIIISVYDLISIPY